MTTEVTGEGQPAAVVAEPAAVVAPVIVETNLGTPEPVTPAAPVITLDQPAAGAEVTYDPTGDVGLDVALGFVGKLGIPSTHPAMEATATGDFSLIKAHLATMGDKATGWEQMVSLAEASFARQDAATKANAASISAAVVSVAGGAENWNTIKAWASKTASPAEKEAFNAMLTAGPVQARAAAAELRGLYQKAAGTVVTPKPAVRDGASTGSAPVTGPLTPREYAAATRALQAKLGHRMEASPEYAQLRQRLAR